jgi:hypothetical protein
MTDARVIVVGFAREGDGRPTIAALGALSAALHEIGVAAEASARAFERMRIEAPEAFEPPRIERITRTPPPFANPAKLARGEHRRGKPPQWRNR